MESSCVLELRRKRYSDVNVKVHLTPSLTLTLIQTHEAHML